MAIEGWVRAHPAGFLAVITALSLLVGSFLNVVIHRLPIMLHRQWARDCRELLSSGDPDESDPEPPYNLVVPRSACPQCGHAITAVENIPLLSYLILRGRCRGCGTRISVQYPLVEALTAGLSLAVAWHFGYSWQGAGALLLGWALIALSIIDLHTKLLPDVITLPLLWLGLIANSAELFTDLHSGVLGAVAGYLSLWTVYQLFRLLTGKEGMGYGDFKLLAMLGAWLGWQLLPLIIVLSSVVGALIGVAMIALRGRDRDTPIPFGPYLAIAGWIALLWGPWINSSYLDLVLH